MSRPEADAFLARATRSLQEAGAWLQEQLLAGAVSRAYYAMFQAGQALLADAGVVAKTHKGLHARLQELGLVDAELRRALGRAQGLREHADYDVAYEASGAEAAEVVHDARRFVARVQEKLAP